MHDMIRLVCPILFHLKLRESVGGAEVGQNLKVGVLGGHVSMCPHQFLTKYFLSGSLKSTNPLYINDIGVQPY